MIVTSVIEDIKFLSIVIVVCYTGRFHKPVNKVATCSKKKIRKN